MVAQQRRFIEGRLRAHSVDLRPPDTGNLEQDLIEHLRSLWSWWRSSSAGEIVDGPAVDVAVSMLTGMSWLHLVTANLGNLDDIDNSVAVIVKGLRVR
ncbi:hypothetical protein QNM99_10310 [Pseudomonas sp. PCH446]